MLDEKRVVIVCHVTYRVASRSYIAPDRFTTFQAHKVTYAMKRRQQPGASTGQPSKKQRTSTKAKGKQKQDLLPVAWPEYFQDVSVS